LEAFFLLSTCSCSFSLKAIVFLNNDAIHMSTAKCLLTTPLRSARIFARSRKWLVNDHQAILVNVPQDEGCFSHLCSEHNKAIERIFDTESLRDARTNVVVQGDIVSK
ncbi:hypothetical protein KCU74_g16, partial [Aureobasidium melanogenum]